VILLIVEKDFKKRDLTILLSGILLIEIQNLGENEGAARDLSLERECQLNSKPTSIKVLVYCSTDIKLKLLDKGFIRPNSLL
jgi:hypothetical protein